MLQKITKYLKQPFISFSYTKFKKSMEKDWLEEIKKFYLSINPVYRHSFWILFIIINIVFSFYTINFLCGNHDWAFLIKGKSIKGSFFEGRYGGYILSNLLTNGLYLPIISPLLAFAALALFAVMLAVYWKIPQRTAYYVIFGLVLTITPYTLGWLWFGFSMVNIFYGRCFIIIGLVLSVKYALNGSKKQKIWSNLLAIFFLNFGISIYQAFIGTIIIAVAGRILMEMLDWNTLKHNIRNTVKQYIFTIINVFFAVVIYKIILKYMEYKGFIRDGFYNMQTTPLFEMFPKALNCIKSAWQQFTEFSMPFYPDMLTKLFLILSCIFVGQIILNRKSVVTKILILLGFVLTLFLTKIVALISEGNFALHTARIEFCGYVLFNALIVALCLKSKGILQNVKILLCLAIIWLFAVNSIWQQRTWKFGTDAETMIANRMQYSLETNADFNKDKKYTILQVGKPISSRENFYPKQRYSYKDPVLFTGPLTPYWRAFAIPNFYNFGYVKTFIKANNFTNPKFISALKRLYKAGLLDNANAWPAENSIIVYEDLILVITDENDLQKAKKLLSEKVKKEGKK